MTPVGVDKGCVRPNHIYTFGIKPQIFTLDHFEILISTLRIYGTKPKDKICQKSYLVK